MAKCLGRCVMLSISCFQMVLEQYIYTHMFYTCRLASSIYKKKKRSSTCVKMLVLKICKQRDRCLLCNCFTFCAGLKFLKIQILEKIQLRQSRVYFWDSGCQRKVKLWSPFRVLGFNCVISVVQPKILFLRDENIENISMVILTRLLSCYIINWINDEWTNIT